MCNPKISIVVPVLDEAEYINSLVERLRSQDGIAHFEIIVVDGDPRGATIGVIRDDGVITRVAEKGRACQMNAGAEAAKGEILLFLHADTQLPENALAKIEGVLENQNYVAGAFDLSIASKRLSLRFIAARASLRSRITRVPYGDQAIFIRKSYFDKIGGFEEVPLLEDVELMCRIRKRGDKIIILPDLVTTSARRWEKEGVFFTTLRNMLIINLYRLGVSPERLARYYRYGPEKEH
ncbi:MAG: TIGR04283 family arsenosugar biosynthesis glycosyltransferase [Phycisphaerales bacterium]|nr:MAG: TIGR04283 family arsenosugar biosynthesis glycosyltransferase [Phycisphaerales bacterium]